jgi:multiple sugar transport system ATP-binding protein
MPVDRAVLAAAHGKSITLGVRPEDLELTTEGSGIPVTVDVVEELGADAYIYGTAKVHQHMEADEESDAPEKPFIARVDGRRPPKKGETVYLSPKQGHIHLFDEQTGQRLD